MASFLTPAMGHWSFIVGLAIAVLVGLTVPVPGAAVLLFLLGILVGLVNIGERESTPFLVAVIALLVIGVAGLQLGDLNVHIANILTQFVAFVSAAALIVAVKQALTFARS